MVAPVAIIFKSVEKVWFPFGCWLGSTCFGNSIFWLTAFAILACILGLAQPPSSRASYPTTSNSVLETPGCSL